MGKFVTCKIFAQFILDNLYSDFKFSWSRKTIHESQAFDICSFTESQLQAQYYYFYLLFYYFLLQTELFSEKNR